MLSPYEILTTIKGLHSTYSLDFNNLTKENYHNFCTELTNQPDFCRDIKVYAFYSQAFSYNNIHVSNYINRFIQLAAHADDYKSIIELDNILYPSDHFFSWEQECIFSSALHTTAYGRNPNAYSKHHFRKYFSFDKFSELNYSSLEHGLSTNAKLIVNDILGGTLMGFSKLDIEHLKKIVYSPVSSLMLVNPTEIYMMNPEALGEDPAYKRSVSLYYDLIGEGLVSADMAALTLCFADKQLFDFMLTALDEHIITSIGKNFLAMFNFHKNRKSVVSDLDQRIDRFIELATNTLLKSPEDVVKLSRMVGEDAIPLIKDDFYRGKLIAHIATAPGIGMESIKTVLSQYSENDLSTLVQDMRACPALASMISELPSPMRRRLLESDLSL